ncbi:MAG: PAS domain S-box protein [Planctomycetes bacterium]|nr:PAS domain S-box protein [Planctomycetota bacterium]
MTEQLTEVHLRAAIEASPSGVLLVGPDGRIVLVNREVERLFGYTRAELLGEPVERLVPERFRARHPEQRAGFFADPRARAMGAGRDLHGLRKDGKEVPVEIGLTPVPMSTGTYVVSSIVDVSERRRAEQRFRDAVESSPNGMVMMDRAGRIVLVNREIERMFGYERAALLGRAIEVLVPERFREAHPSFRATYFEHPSKRSMGVGRDLFGLRADGAEFPVEIGLNPVETDDGIFVLGSVVDISARKVAERERRNLEEQLRQAQKLEAIGTLAGGIAHDFNNVLAAIVGFGELVLGALEDDHPARGDIEHLLRSAERGRQLAARILAVGRRHEPQRTAIALGAVLGEAAELLRATLPASIEIRVVADSAAPTILADVTSVHQILINLATNAAHAMPDGGVLTLVAESFYVRDTFARLHPELREGLHARLVVHDTGHGMPEAVRARAFEPFFTTKPAGEGTGLGLAMVHAIVRDHDGLVELESAPGAGATVRCWFPAIDANAQAADVTEVEVPHGAGERVLYVDDEPTLSEIGRRRLTSLGYRVTAVTDGTLALELVRAEGESFDLVVTDYFMPKLTGLQLAREVVRARPRLPIVLMTGFAGELSREALAAAGIRCTLAKPTTLREFARTVSEALGTTAG